MTWREQAACVDSPVPFIDAPEYEVEAKEVCLACPVMADCRAFFDRTETWPAEMVVGGETRDERIDRRRKYRHRRRTEELPCPACRHTLKLGWEDRHGIRRCLADRCRCASHRALVTPSLLVTPNRTRTRLA